jgi:hypothetical protein
MILGIVALLLCSATLAVWYRFRWRWMPALGAVLVAAAWLWAP